MKSVFIASKMINIVIIWDALLDLLPFAQFKKHEKHQLRILCILMNSYVQPVISDTLILELA